MGLTIRIADKKDAPLIADLCRKTFYDTFAQHNTKENMDLYLSRQLTRESMIAEVENPGNIFLLAYLDGQPAGYAQLKPDSIPASSAINSKEPAIEGSQAPVHEHPAAGASAMEIYRIYAEQSAIGKGVGKALMHHCLEIAREKGKEWIWLGVWEHNQRAIDFYTKWGFEKFGEHVFLLGQDIQTDWEMKKKL